MNLFEGNNLQELLEKKKKLDQEITEKFRAAIKPALLKFLQEHPYLEKIEWTQYTPWFNDGEACHFGVGEVELYFTDLEKSHDLLDVSRWDHDLKECVPLEGEEKINYLKSNYSEYGIYSGYLKSPLKEEVKELNKVLHQNESILQQIFGDHAKVVITQTEVVVEEYEHD